MTSGIFRRFVAAAGLLAMALGGPVASGALAQVTTIDPNDAIDADLAPQARDSDSAPMNDAPLDEGYGATYDSADQVPDPGPPAQPQLDYEAAAAPTGASSGYQKDDLIGAAEGVFGKGAEGLAGLIEDILRKQGEPNGYIVGREASGAFVVGLRYGSGTLHHKVEGDRPVYWTGPSIGFDAGANAGNTFVLVYNLYDSEDLYKRFGAGEGAAYLVGGFHTSYLRRGDVVLIPVRLGLGLRLGVNAGYMKFTRKRSFVPF